MFNTEQIHANEFLVKISSGFMDLWPKTRKLRMIIKGELLDLLVSISHSFDFANILLPKKLI